MNKANNNVAYAVKRLAHSPCVDIHQTCRFIPLDLTSKGLLVRFQDHCLPQILTRVLVI